MAWAKVQSVTGTTVSGTGAPSLSGVAAGNMISVQLSYFQGAANSGVAPSTPGDSNGSPSIALAPVGSGSNGASAWVGYCVWYDDQVPAGTHNFSITAPNPANNILKYTVTEWSGDPTSGSSADASALNHTNTTTAQTTTSGTTGTLSNPNELLLAGISIASGAGSANIGLTDPPTNYLSLFAAQNTSTSIGMEHSYRIKTSDTAAENPSWSWTDATTVFGQAGIAGFIPAGTGSTIPIGGIIT